MKTNLVLSVIILLYLFNSCKKLPNNSTADIIVTEYESTSNNIYIEVIINNINLTYVYGICWDSVIYPNLNNNVINFDAKKGTSIYRINELIHDKKYYFRTFRTRKDNKETLYDNQFIIKTSPILRWYKGNTHTHTTFSDGNQSLNEVVKAYENLNYNFLFITDHNFITPVKDVSTKDLLVLSGVEDTFSKHIVGLGVNKFILSSSITSSINTIYNQEGIPILAHPIWPHTRVTYKDLNQQARIQHIEIYNGITESGGFKDDGTLWDSLLTNGKKFYGIGCDDSHSAKDIGKGWIVVRSSEFHKDSIMNSIRNGNFYSSTGIEIENIRKNKDSIYIKTRNATDIKFIGRNGQILKQVNSNNANFKIIGIEPYIRVEASNGLGEKAWTQPLVWNY